MGKVKAAVLDREIKAGLLSQSVIKSSTISEEIRGEFVRKSIHLLIAFVPFFAALNVTVTLALLGFGVIIYTYAEIQRQKGRSFPLITAVTLIAAREKNKNKFVIGPITLAIGAMLALLFYPEPASMMAIFALAFGDGFASLFGKLFGGLLIPFTKGKTVIGSFAGFLAVFYVVYTMSGRVGAAFFIALSAMVLEALPTGDMDNIVIPVGTGIVALKLLVI